MVVFLIEWTVIEPNCGLSLIYAHFFMCIGIKEAQNCPSKQSKNTFGQFWFHFPMFSFFVTLSSPNCLCYKVVDGPKSNGINRNAADYIVFSSRCGKNIGIVKIMATIGIFPFWEFSHKISFTYSYRKLPISQKVSTLELWDQLFWIHCIILHRKHPLPTRKKNFKRFNTKMTFLRPLSQQPW